MATGTITVEGTTYYGVTTYGDLGNNAFTNVNDNECVINGNLTKYTSIKKISGVDDSKCVSYKDITFPSLVCTGTSSTYGHRVELILDSGKYHINYIIYKPTSGETLTDNTPRGINVGLSNVNIPDNCTLSIGGVSSSNEYIPPGTNDYFQGYYMSHLNSGGSGSFPANIGCQLKDITIKKTFPTGGIYYRSSIPRHTLTFTYNNTNNGNISISFDLYVCISVQIV